VADASTLIVERTPTSLVLRIPRYALRVMAGPDTGLEVRSSDGRLTVGTSEGVTLRLTDPTVSRFHLEIEATPSGVVVRDLGSTNGTKIGAVAVREVVIDQSTELSVGRSRLRLSFDAERESVTAGTSVQFGGLLGQSVAMRRVISTLAMAAPTSAPVLITGESGTGKEVAARAIHAGSPRSGGPLEVVDCGGLPATLIESELFGHERGAFTGATEDREGAFERAEGGTLFLDELGELPLELQPKLLRAIGEGEIRRIGGKRTRKVDVRLLAATNRDLRRHVNSGQFRADLYYRLAVIQVTMPPLRERLDDLPLLLRALLDTIVEDRALEVHVEPDQALLDTLSRHSWPGNIRELRNYLEHLLILRVPPAVGPVAEEPSPSEASFAGLERLPLRMAKSELIERFERHYVTQLLKEAGGNVAEAARRAGVDRVTLFRTLRRHRIRGEDT
jgi:two-component system, NtrC family, response regulator GlrR